MLIFNNLHVLPVKLFFLFENFACHTFGPVSNKIVIIMRKFFLIFSAIVFLALPAFSESTTEVFMEFYLNGNEEDGTTVNRSRMRIPTIDVVYDSETETIKITSSELFEANVYVYDCSGTIVSYANTLNTTVSLPSSDSYTIYIESKKWYGIGYINKRNIAMCIGK